MTTSILGWLRGRRAALLALASREISADLSAPVRLAIKNLQELHQKASTEAPSVHLVRQPSSVSSGLRPSQALGKISKIQPAHSHLALQVAHQSLAPLLLREGNARHKPDSLRPRCASPYSVTTSLAKTEQNRYNITKYGDAKMSVRKPSRPKTEHFLKLSRAVTISAYEIASMSDEHVYTIFKNLRWPDSAGQAVCPHCKNTKCYEITTRKIFKCSGCRKTFSVTSGTPFHSHKLPLKKLLFALITFVDGAKGKAALELRRNAGVSYKSAFVLLHKIREVISNNRSGIVINGSAEVDSAYFGGSHRPPNGGREGKSATNKRRKMCLLSIVGRSGGTITKIIMREAHDEIWPHILRHIDPNAVVYTDEHGAYGSLPARQESYQINHRIEYARDGHINTNAVESFFSRVRRAEIGTHHHIAGPYLHLYGAEMAYRSDRRRVDNGSVFEELGSMILHAKASRHWNGYWQKRLSS